MSTKFINIAGRISPTGYDPESFNGVLGEGLTVRDGKISTDIVGRTWNDIPMYREDRVPGDAPSEYLAYSSDNTPVYTYDEEKATMLNAIRLLQEEVGRLKRAFTNHMDCGDFTNNKINTVANTKNVVAKEPLWASITGEPMENPKTEIPEITPTPDDIPMVKHLTIKSGKYSEMNANKNYLLPYELLWCYDVERLYIKQKNGKIVLITGKTDGDVIPPDDETPDLPELPDMDNLESITFISPNGTRWKTSVNNYGEMEIIDERDEDPALEPPTNNVINNPSSPFDGMSSSLYLPKLYINSVYCGGIDSNDLSYNTCSHNFIELSNLTTQDINLNGISIQYTINGNQWEVLPLKGVIKAKSTYLIRGAQCSIMDTNTTIIKVKTFDIEWFTKTSGYKDLIKFDNIKAKFVLRYGTESSTYSMPYQQDGTKAYCELGYIDMVGLSVENPSSDQAIDGFEKAPFTRMAPNRMYLKYFTMDNVTQATKAIGSRSNALDWQWINLDNTIMPHVENYTPKASFEKKNIFYDKTQLQLTPNMINISFGINAHTTRCFNWVSVGYYDEFLKYRRKGSNDWVVVETFKEGDGRTQHTNWVYNRKRVLATNKVSFTSHKIIINTLTAGEYEYMCGREGFWSELRGFKVDSKNTNADSSLTFIHTSDQQGFNWSEYYVWGECAKFIRKESYESNFHINTGDATQNGNRINEWLDYFNNGDVLHNGLEYEGLPYNGTEQMYALGNNDLCPENVSELGEGADKDKINGANFHFFFNYELDETNLPIVSKDEIEYFVPSLYSWNYNSTHFICINSEIPLATETDIYDGILVNEFMRGWVEQDLKKASEDPNTKWIVAYMHEMPFTIITKALIDDYKEDPINNVRGGSRLNTEISDDQYWCSRMFEKYGVRLVLGGHKHTFSISYPLKEDYNSETNKTNSMTPIIQTSDPTFEDRLTTEDKKLCKVEVTSKLTAPVYCMCQATGYKQASNKEKPSPGIPWLYMYYPATNGDVLQEAQLHPFYGVINITNDNINCSYYRLNGIMLGGGKFNINTLNPGPIVREEVVNIKLQNYN